MTIIYNRLIPFKGFKAINIFGILFVRKECKDRMDDITINHESIHSAQQKEMLWLFFYLWYVVEWLIKLCYYRDSYKAYKAISFEREAYSYQYDEEYLTHRRHYSWWKLMCV